MAEQNVWTRSANRNNGNNTFIVNSSGNVNNNNAQNPKRRQRAERPRHSRGAARGRCGEP